MSKTTKRKYVMDEVLVQELKTPEENQTIVRIVASKGNNLHEVEDGEGVRFLMSMPQKFRKSVWVKRGDCVLVEPISEGDKVRAEMVAVLTPEHKKHMLAAGVWPQRFLQKDELVKDAEYDPMADGNTNRPAPRVVSSDDDTDSDSSEDSSGTPVVQD